MADPTLLAKARKARFDDLPNFSGHPAEDVERFLKSIKNIAKVNEESDKPEVLEIVRGKLIRSAGLWFDNNEHSFKKWADFEAAFRNRYFSTTIIHKKFDKLKQRTQLLDESVTSYIDDVINLCRDIDPNMSDSIIIQHLMSGINPEFRKELSRRQSCMNSLDEFLKHTKIEQDLYDTFEKTRQLSIESQQSQFSMYHPQNPSVATTIKQPPVQQYCRQQNNGSEQSSINQWNSLQAQQRQPRIPFSTTWQSNSPNSHDKTEQVHQQSIQYAKFYDCRICGRNNHRTIDCFYKHTTGCFKCGENHQFRQCPMLQNFQ